MSKHDLAPDGEPVDPAAGEARPSTLADSPRSYRTASREGTARAYRAAPGRNSAAARDPLFGDEPARYRAARSTEASLAASAVGPAPHSTGGTETAPRGRGGTGATGRTGAAGSRTARRAAERRRQDGPWDTAVSAARTIRQATRRLARELSRGAGAQAAVSAANRTRSIVVSPLPSARHLLTEQLPTARRMAGSLRDWALTGGGEPPVTGSRRAPGTLPIERWLLIGRHRQQALLAALVAVGVMLVLVPTQQNRDDITALNAADRQVTQGDHAGRADTRAPEPAASAGVGQRTAPQGASAPVGRPRTPPTKPAPSAAQTSAPAPNPPRSEATASGVDPKAHGPADSLRQTGSAAVALTFDDGPDPEQTPAMLQLLAEYRVKATFCLVGARALRYPELVRQIVAGGHRLCNHSWNHSFTLGLKTTAEIRADLAATDRAIRAAVPDAEIPYFRAPGGIFTDRLVSVADESDMTSLYWAVDPRDWDHSTDADDATHIDRVVAEVKQHVRPGSIILSHDFNQPDTVQAYEQLLPYLTERFEIGPP